MKTISPLVGILLTFGFTPHLHASPVSFKDGWGVMSMFTEESRDLQINFSPSNRYSLGASTFEKKREDRSTTFHMGQFNYLFKRWNELDSQANIFGSLGAGGRSDDKDGDGFAGFVGLEGNYETRRFYTSLLSESLISGSDSTFHRFRYRVGGTPYTAPIDQLNTWLLLQLELSPELEDSFTVTPVARFFLDNVALELGASIEGDFFAATMIHF